MDIDRGFTDAMSEQELAASLSSKLVPILARLMACRFPAAVQDEAVSLRDVAMADWAELSLRAEVFVSCWYRTLEDRFLGSGLTCGQLDGRMLPRGTGRAEVAERFESTGLYVLGTSLIDTELVEAALCYLCQQHAQDGELPAEMLRLLELRQVPVDCCL